MIGVVILNYNNWKDTIACIESIHEGSADLQIYLVDNASPSSPPPGFDTLIQSRNIVFLKSKKNVGYAAGNNIGIRQALSDGCGAVLISNNDVRFEPGCIAGLYEYLCKHPNVGIVGPKILDADGNVQKSCLCRKTGLKEKYLVRTRLNLFFRRQHRTYFGLDRDYDVAFSVYAVQGSCFMISPSCVREVFPFDEGTFLYEEEYIVGIRMEEKGYETHYNPSCVIRHLHGQSTDQVKPFAYTCETVSEIYYCRNYLRAANWQIYPLYLYRIIKYIGKSMKSGEFRAYWREFRNRTRKLQSEWRLK
ncbi:MAG: glycosyltransferase family 2 protein [Eubacterium sp.]|nr:glycosyltransferase family 2 protein [Eubacterium sp.]